MSRRTLTNDEIDARLREADATFNVGPLSEAMVAMMQEMPTLTFAVFEARLRAIGSETYLIARPRGTRPLGTDVRFLFNGKKAPWYLWICLHGIEERDEELSRLGTSEGANRKALAECGCLSIQRPMATH